MPTGGTSWEYTGDYGLPNGLAYDAGAGTLYALHYLYGSAISEISIPALSASTTIGDLNRATQLQTRTTAFEGRLGDITPNASPGQLVGSGIFVSGSTVVMDGFVFYDANGEADGSHFTRSTTLSTTTINPTTAGTAYRIGDVLNPGYTTGPMGAIPSAWQSRLGNKTHLVGTGSLSIIERTSYGPSLHAFNLADVIAGTSPASVTSLAYYTSAHATLGAYGGISATNDTYWTATDNFAGIVFPEGWDTVLVFGNHGVTTRSSTGGYGYGIGGAYTGADPESANPLLRYAPWTLIAAGDLDEAEGVGTLRCYDAWDTTKSDHSYPYRPTVWFYSAHDLAQAAAGTINPWDVVPYSVQTLPGADTFRASPPGGVAIVGAAYDSANKKIYLMASYEDGVNPVFHVYTHP